MKLVYDLSIQHSDFSILGPHAETINILFKDLK